MQSNHTHRLRFAVASALAMALIAGCALDMDDEDVTSSLSQSESVDFRASDGTRLHVSIDYEDDLVARPVIVEFTPYGTSSPLTGFGPEYNLVQVHMRGTGLSAGRWGAIGPLEQQDIAEFLEWACDQPWSNGRIGLYGFSASAIAVYNSMHLPLSCVEAAVLMSGTNELYRDLLYPGGIPNLVPTVAVGVGIGALLVGSVAEGGSPGEIADALAGLIETGANVLMHPLADSYWEERSQRPGPNTFPVLVGAGFYDVEARGAFESFQALRATNPGTHLLVQGAHDGFPAGLSPHAEHQRWFDHYLRDVDNGIDVDPVVQLWLGVGSHDALLDDDFEQVDATDWPVLGTKWQRLYLSPHRSGTVWSINDGSLEGEPPLLASARTYPAVSSLVPAGDVNTTAIVTNALAFAGFGSLPALTELRAANPVSLTYTTAPFSEAVDVAGPASLVVTAATSAPDSDLHVVVADVWPDGRAFPVGQGRLRTSFHEIDLGKSMVDVNGEIVQPYVVHSERSYAGLWQAREYRVELWPIGNRFEVGHRLRVYIMGTSPYMAPPAPGVNTITIGGITQSRLLLPVLPGSDVCAAIGGGPGCS